MATEQPKRDLSKLNQEDKPPEEDEAKVQPSGDAPFLAIRECGTGQIIRTIPIQRGFSWKDVNAFASTIMMQPNTLRAGWWLDMENAYWSQDIVR